jgi:hypothetical protein
MSQAVFKQEPYSRLQVARIFENDDVIVEITKLPVDTMGIEKRLQITIHNRKRNGNWDDCSATLDEEHFAAIGSVAFENRDEPDWPPQDSASSHPEGTLKYGSTGQQWKVENGQWVRLNSPERDKEGE